MVVKHAFLFLLFLGLAGKVQAQMPVIGADSLEKHYQYKVHRFIDRDTVLGDFYTIDLNGVSVFAGVKEKKANKPEYRVTWQELPVYKKIMTTVPRNDAMLIMKTKGAGPFSADIQRQFAVADTLKDTLVPTLEKPLLGYRFVIDPGHFASDSLSSRLEDKYIDFYVHNENDSQRVKFFESQMTYNTAFVLSNKLRAAGAEVLLTRTAYEYTAFSKTFERWKKDDYPRTLDSLLKIYPKDPNLLALKSGKLKDNKSIYKFVFRDAELRKRSEIINAFHPDLTIIIHYNVDEENKDWKKPTDKNFCMTFVGGAFQAGELSDPEKRFDFLRLLLTDELEQSMYVSGLAASHFTSELEVPLAKQADATYLRTNCIAADEPGVFCRNLSLTRMVQGPVIYGETLYQDNKDECIKLFGDSKRLASGRGGNGVRTTEVGEAYYNAILDWVKMH